jgi:hypothetical protein
MILREEISMHRAVYGFVLFCGLTASAWAAEPCRVPVTMGKSYLVNGMQALVTTSCTGAWLEGLQGQQRMWVNLDTITSIAEAPELPAPGSAKAKPQKSRLMLRPE